MSKLTADLIERSAGLITPTAEWQTDGTYQMMNTEGVEIEVAEFLWGLVRMIKPKQILETGTHYGISSSYMAQGLKDNGFGKLTTLEYIPENAAKARSLHQNLGLGDIVEIIEGDAKDYNPGDTRFDLMFLDTERSTRFNELTRLWGNLTEGGIVLIHDLDPDMEQGRFTEGWPELPAFMVGLIRQHGLQSMHFPTPRGLYMAQKWHKDFYTTRLLGEGTSERLLP